MIRRVFVAACVAFGSFAWTAIISGCEEDEVKSVKQIEQRHEAQPEPVSPGEPIVE